VGSNPDDVIEFFNYYGPGVESASNRNEYQARKDDNLTAICEPIV
jgi:hypothetical protein